MAGPVATTNLEEAVSRPHWEARHEWESRIKFVEDNAETHGLEKAVNLSFVWANMKFLGCSYPPKTEALVAHYPVPPLDELKARRRCKQSLKKGPADIDSNDVDGPSPSKQQKLDPNPMLDVSAFISTIRSESEQEEVDASSLPVQPKIIEDIATALCLCDKCLGKTPDAGEKGKRVLERYSQRENTSFTFDFIFDEVQNWKAGSQNIGHRCCLQLNGVTIVEKVASKKKESKSAAAAAFLYMVEEWQERNRQPSCPNLPPPSNVGRGSFPPPSGRGFSRGGPPHYPRGGGGWRHY